MELHDWNKFYREEELRKAHLYSRKEFKNGKYIYYYDKNNNFARMLKCQSKTLNVNKNMTEKQILIIANNYIKNVWIPDWKKNPTKSICKELKNKKIVFQSISMKHLSQTGNNSTGAQQRNVSNLMKHIPYLPCAKEILEDIGIHSQSRYEPYSAPQKDGSVGIVYQTLAAFAPVGDVNNYVQVTVSQKKYKNGILGDTIYISVVGTKNIKKSTVETQCFNNCVSAGSSVQGYALLKSPDSSSVRSHPSHNEINIPQDTKKSIWSNCEYVYLS